MAKAPAKPEADAAPEDGAVEVTPKRGKKLLIIVVAAVLLLVLLGGGAAYLLLSKKGHDDKAHEEGPPKITVDHSKPPNFVPLDTFTVNLQSGEGDHYLQAMIVLKVADPKVADDLKAYMPEIRHRVNLLLSSKLPSEISNIEGREILADQIMIETNFVLGYEPPPRTQAKRTATDEPWGPVLAVLFNSFIIQ